MYDGEVVAGQSASGEGHAVAFNGASAYLYIYGGKITKQENQVGSSIYVTGTSSRVVFGDSDGNGATVEGGVLIEAANAVILNSDTKIDSLDLGGVEATVTDLKAGAQIGIVGEAGTVITGAYEGSEDLTEALIPGAGLEVIKNADNKYQLVKVVDPDVFEPWNFLLMVFGILLMLHHFYFLKE